MQLIKTNVLIVGKDLVQLEQTDGFEHEFGTEIYNLWGCKNCNYVIE
jgi:hypothetical protein|nr:MAG TPA: protein of unknown function (DUF2225) [Caudoviricetes sp.]